MSGRHPPQIALWLLKYFTDETRSESLAGDLVERFESGKSATWFWRQTFQAIGAVAFNGIRQERFATLRGPLAGIIALVVFCQAGDELYRATSGLVEPHARGSHSLVQFWYLYRVPLVVWFLAAAGTSGWLSVRLAGTNVIQATAVTFLSQLPFVASLAWPSWTFANSNPWPTTSVPLRTSAIVILAGMPLATLLGALLAAKGASAAHRLRLIPNP